MTGASWCASGDFPVVEPTKNPKACPPAPRQSTRSSAEASEIQWNGGTERPYGAAGPSRLAKDVPLYTV
jgi:hypothetical protein